jgi:hypothetical protein
LRRVRRSVAAAIVLAGLAAALVSVGVREGSRASAAGEQVTLQIAPRGDGTVSASPVGVDQAGQAVPNPCDENHDANSCTALYPAGTTVVLTAKPDAVAGNSFSGWSTPDCPGTGTCTVKLDDKVTTVVATFSPLDLEVVLSNESKGHVTSAPAGIDCPNKCTAKFPAGSTVMLTATGTTGHTFRAWKPGCEPETAATCTIVVNDQPTAAGVAFDADSLPIVPSTIDVQLSVRKGGSGAGKVSSGRIDCGGTCSGSFGFNTLLTLLAEPDGTSVFGGWGGVCAAGKTSCTIPVGPITNLRVVFDKDATPPSAPGGLVVQGRSRTSLALGWSPATDNLGVTGYRVYLNDAAAGDASAPGHSFEGLACGRSYVLGVDAVDLAGNRSAKATLTAATAICSLAARLAGVAVKGGNVVVMLRVSIPTRARVGLWRGSKRLAEATFPVKPGTNVLRLRVPAGRSGRHTLRIAVTNPNGAAIRITRGVLLPRAR